MPQAMYTKGNRFFTCSLFYLLLMLSCSNRRDIDKYIAENYTEYSNEYRIFKDSLKFYSFSRLKNYEFLSTQKWEIDRMLCLNSKKDKLVAIVMVSSGYGFQGKSDWITQYLGKNINGYWYFFEGGGTLIVPRDMYGKDEMHPLSFHELSQIARKEMFGENALTKKDGKLIVNDEWIDEYFYNNGYGKMGWTVEKNRAQYDSVHWHYIIDKWKHKIDTVEFNKP